MRQSPAVRSETALTVEAALEAVVSRVTGKQVSALTLGNEISVNIEGEHLNFRVIPAAGMDSCPEVISVPTPTLQAV